MTINRRPDVGGDGDPDFDKGRTCAEEPDAGGDGDPDFDQGWTCAEEEEKRSNPFLNLERRNRETADRIDAWRASVALHILTLEDGALAGLSHGDAIARHTASGMLYAYHRFGACLRCRKWLEQAETDSKADNLLRHLVALIVSLGVPIPYSLRDWASAALFTDPPKRRGPPKMNWRRNQKIALAVDVLVKLTQSSVENALSIVADVCRESGIIPSDSDLETIKKIRDRVRQEAKRYEAEVVPR